MHKDLFFDDMLLRYSNPSTAYLLPVIFHSQMWLHYLVPPLPE